MKPIRSMLLSFALTLALAASAFAGAAEDAIKDLASDDFQKREAATATLSAMSDAALPALEKAAQDKDAEVRWRAERAIQSIRARGGKAQGAAAPSSDKKAETPKVEAPQGAGGPLDEVRRQLQAAQEELRKTQPQLDEILKGFGGGELFGGDFSKMLEGMEKRFRDMESGRGPGMARDFWSFRFDPRNGTWERVGGERSPVAEYGLATSTTPAVLKAQLKLDGEPDGRVIDEVRAGSLAEKAGLQPFDLVLKVDGLPVLEEGDLEALAAEGAHALAIVRGGERMELAFATPARATPRATPSEERSPLKPVPAPKATPPAPELPAEKEAPAPKEEAPAKKDGLRHY